MATPTRSFVSLLNECQQKNQCKVVYEEKSAQGPSHDYTFTCQAFVDGREHRVGRGKTKKEAKENAARSAWEALNDSPSDTSAPPISQSSFSQANYSCWLNEFSQKNRVCFSPREKITTTNQGHVRYVCQYVCGEREFPEACGNNKKEARETAATRVYEEIKKQDTVGFDDTLSSRRSEVAALSSSMEILTPNLADDSPSTNSDNFIALLNEHCQKNQLALDFKLVEKRGPDHLPEFLYRAVIGRQEYEAASGRSVKEARQRAAQKAWSGLQQPSTSSRESVIDSTAPLSQDSVSSDGVVFRNSTESLKHVKAKVKLAPHFDGSPHMCHHKQREPNVGKVPVKETCSHQLVKSRFVEEFDSISPLGKGGFGRVFKARRKMEKKFFAVKIVKSSKKAQREVKALSEFSNANIVRYFTAWFEETAYQHESFDSSTFSDSGADSGTKFLYIQMELCEGDTLRAWIDQQNRVEAGKGAGHGAGRRQEAAKIYRQILKAVSYIHSKHFIHRDLKPANIMFGSEGEVKVGDFGLVAAGHSDSDGGNLERTKKTGTRSYMSPEQMTDNYDRKVDIFALGLIYFELLWRTSTSHERIEIWKNIRNRTFPRQFEEKYRIEACLIRRMLSERPDDRPDAVDLISELDKPPHILVPQTKVSSGPNKSI